MIYLRYGSYTAGVKSAATSMAFNELRCRSTQNVDAIKVRDLRQAERRNVLSTRKKWTIIISADELIDSSKCEFLDAFLAADWKEFSTDNWATAIEVVDDAGDAKIDYVKDSKSLPRRTLELTQKEPR